MTEESKNRSGTAPDDGDDSTEGVNLNGRLFYLLALLRRCDALLRHGPKPGPSMFQGQGRVLRLLSLHSPIAQKDLVYLLGIRSQSLGELIAKLEEAGLITRNPDPDDQRTWVVEITDEGRKIADGHAAALQDDPFAVLTDDERRQMASMLDRVSDALEQKFPGMVDRRLQMMRRMWFNQDGPDFSDFGWGPSARGGRRFGRGGWPGGPEERGRSGR